MASAYIVALLGMPKRDVLRGKANDASLFVDDAGSGTSSAYINTNVVTHDGKIQGQPNAISVWNGG